MQLTVVYLTTPCVVNFVEAKDKTYSVWTEPIFNRVIIMKNEQEIDDWMEKNKKRIKRVEHFIK